mmetsp:Transcript_4982/g.11180  ORF Transcript_4982/g.11180 Transcript_4982/m.11180 type:complete len:141 (-) Transcript_4982:336-758(-)
MLSARNPLPSEKSPGWIGLAQLASFWCRNLPSTWTMLGIQSHKVIRCSVSSSGTSAKASRSGFVWVSTSLMMAPSLPSSSTVTSKRGYRMVLVVNIGVESFHTQTQSASQGTASSTHIIWLVGPIIKMNTNNNSIVEPCL